MGSVEVEEGTQAQHSFTAPPETHAFNGILFDLDGTIIDSTKAIIKHWNKIARELDADPDEILKTSHGRRSIDTIKLYKPELANWEYVSHVEGLIPKEYGADAVEIPGARALLSSLEEALAPWAVVTSASRPLCTGWLEKMKMAKPKNLVTAEDVNNGKPDPECYLLGRDRLNIARGREGQCLVVEDAPSGIKAGKAAGFKVVAVATTHKIQQLKDAGADWIVKDLRSVKLSKWDSGEGEVHIEISDALKPYSLA